MRVARVRLLRTGSASALMRGAARGGRSACGRARCRTSSSSASATAALRAIADGGDVERARRPTARRRCIWAAHHGDLELVAALLARGADPERRATTTAPRRSPRPPSKATAEIVEALLDAGADVESPNAEGQTALMVVARTGHVDAARAAARARRERQRARKRGAARSALMWAAAQKQPEMIRVLLEHGAAVDARGRAHDWQRRVTAEPRIKIMQKGGFTPLLYAAREGCVACVEPLVAGGADIDLSDPYGMTPLVLALLQPELRHGRRLIERGADVNQWDWWGRSPLYLGDRAQSDPGQPPRRPAGARRAHGPRRRAIAARARRATSTCGLKQQPPLRNEPGDRGFTDGSPDVLVVNTGATALHAAAKASDDEAVKLLLEHGANVARARTSSASRRAWRPPASATGTACSKSIPTIGRYKTGADAVATMKLLLAAGAKLDGRTTELEHRFPAAARRGAHGRARRRVPGLERSHRVPARAWARRSTRSRRAPTVRRRATSRSPKAIPRRLQSSIVC